MERGRKRSKRRRVVVLVVDKGSRRVDGRWTVCGECEKGQKRGRPQRNAKGRVVRLELKKTESKKGLSFATTKMAMSMCSMSRRNREKERKKNSRSMASAKD